MLKIDACSHPLVYLDTRHFAFRNKVDFADRSDCAREVDVIHV